ncbi:OLC1v1024497C1 [Oldenlandia corymbosa var. corymbosa]|uniref:OLC1v1024497C1 n=1 Tax=Oldenlandia corymbosa var. corymbosa TaxID=529605 RepID=A0AAV1C4S7_OLDCO|nr:OLC1v1024497C1 [Oldenlandia corymbosa var. corymbosa]
MLRSDRVMCYVVDDSVLMNAECGGSKSIEQSYYASKSTQGHSSVVDQLESDNHINQLGDDVMLDDALRMEVTFALKECGEDNSGNELGVDNVMVEEDALHKEISSVTKNNDLAVFTLVDKTARSEKEAYDLYNDHARLIGFSVRVGKQKFRGKTDKVRIKKFCCNREGYKRSGENGDVCHERINFWCGCPAYIHFTVDKDGLWTCTKHLVDHNHDLVPNEMIGLLRSQREVDENDMKIIRDMTRSGIPLVDAYKLLDEYDCHDDKWLNAVRGEDLRCSQGNIDSYLPGDLFLESIRRVYTVEAFREVQQLHKDGMLCRQEQLEVSNDGNIVMYNIWRFGIEHFKHVIIHDTRGRKTNARIAADRTRASVASDLHYPSMPFPYPKGAAQDFSSSGNFAAVNASHQSMPSLNVNSSGFSFTNPSVAAQDFSGAGASTSVNAYDQSMPFINQNSGGFSFPIPKGADQEFQGASTSVAMNASHQNMTFMNQNFGGFSFPNRREAAREAGAQRFFNKMFY